MLQTDSRTGDYILLNTTLRWSTVQEKPLDRWNTFAIRGKRPRYSHDGRWSTYRQTQILASATTRWWTAILALHVWQPKAWTSPTCLAGLRRIGDYNRKQGAIRPYNNRRVSERTINGPIYPAQSSITPVYQPLVSPLTVSDFRHDNPQSRAHFRKSFRRPFAPEAYTFRIIHA